MKKREKESVKEFAIIANQFCRSATSFSVAYKAVQDTATGCAADAAVGQVYKVRDIQNLTHPHGMYSSYALTSNTI